VVEKPYVFPDKTPFVFVYGAGGQLQREKMFKVVLNAVDDPF